MKARWVSSNPSPSSPIIGETIIAKWWPSKYYKIMTWENDNSSPLALLTKSIKLNIKYEDVIPDTVTYITTVYPCNKSGIINYSNNSAPIYQKEYTNIQEAKDGHENIIKLIELGYQL